VSLTQRLRSLGVNTTIYFVAEGLIRAVSVLLVPLYTRAMTPRDYGILAVTTSVTFMLSIFFSLSVDSGVLRLIINKNEEEQRRLYGNVLMFLLVGSLFLAVCVEGLGRAGFLDFFRSVPYDPYLRYTVWTAYLGTFITVPSAMFVALEQPRKVLRLKLTNTCVVIALGITFIVVLDQGAIGALRAALLSAVFTALFAGALMVRRSSFALSWPSLKVVLLFSVPLVPHLLSHWILFLSDRFVLQGFVTEAQLGLYSLGYTVGAVAVLFTGAFANALAPTLVRQLDDPGSRANIPRVATYSLVVLAALCLGIALLGGTVIRVVTPAEYHGATEIVPWIAFSHIFLAIYIVVAQATWYAKRTNSIAAASIAAGVINVGFVFALAPRYGIMGAAVATLIGYAALALIHGFVANWIYPIPWEYRRWGKLLVASGACLALGLVVREEVSLVGIVGRGSVAALGFPVALTLLGFWTARERQQLVDGLRRLARGVSARAFGRV